MYMKKIGVDLSPHQRRRLHNGHKVRVKKGEGIMLVNPGKFDTMSRTFLRGKAKEIQLSVEEIMANRMTSPEAHNYNELSRPPSVAPQVAPIRGNVAGGRISNAGGPRGIRVHTMDGLKKVSDHLQRMEDATGLDVGDQLKAGLGNLMANMATASMGRAGVDARKNILGGAVTASTFYGDMAKKALADARKGISGGGRGNFYGDNQIALGWGIGSHIKKGRGAGQIGVSGNLLANQRVLPQALQSQPYSANWSMANQMPPQYQQFNRS
jgi:hypothetical protein